MEILSTESLEKLRDECKNNPHLISQTLDELVKEFSLSLIPFSNKKFDLRNLQIPIGSRQETNKDLENCKTMLESLNNLTAAEATDERLWTTLCFSNYSEYSRARWPVENAKNVENHVQVHWFAKTNRNRMRDNSISRLWWMGHIARKVSSSDYETVLKTLFFNSDYRSSLLERNTSANSIKVLVCILEISQEAFIGNIEFNRAKFRNFMKYVDLIGKRTALPSLTHSELKDILTPIYYNAYKDNTIQKPVNENNKKIKKSRIFGRFKK
jgi:hypothetical protein